VGDILPHLKRVVEERFVIGPVAERDFWNGERASMAIAKGARGGGKAATGARR
jgi:hypothetical protein